MPFTLDTGFETPPADPNAVDPTAPEPGGVGQGNQSSPFDTGSYDTAPPADTGTILGDTGGVPTDEQRRAVQATLEGAGALPGSNTEAGMVQAAQLRGQSIGNNNAVGGAPSGPANNFATFSGDPTTGETFGTPTPGVGTAVGAHPSPLDSMPPIAGPTSGLPGVGRPTTAADLAGMQNYPGPGQTAGLPGANPTAASPLPGGNGINGPLLGDHVPPAGPVATPGVHGGPGLDPQYASNAFDKAFYDKFGFFDNRYNSQAAMEQNLLRGDTVIRPQAEYMAQFDPNLKRELAAIGGTPNFYNSQNEATWANAHNAEIAARVGAGQFQGNQAAGQNVLNQQVHAPANPMDNAHAMMTDTMQKTLVDSLASLGATGFKIGYDPYGNSTIDYVSKSGTPEQIKNSLVDMANAVQVLRDRVTQQAAAAPAASAANPPGGGGGGNTYAPRGNTYAPRGNTYAPRGGGGTYAPPAAAAAPAPTMPTGEDTTNATGSSAGWDQLAAQRLAQFARMGPNGGAPAVPQSVARAVGWMPSIMPGGNSPYDEPMPGG